MSFEVIKWVYNKTFVKIMKNTVHFRNFENSRLNKSDVKIGEDERFLIVTFIFQAILNSVLRQIPYSQEEEGQLPRKPLKNERFENLRITQKSSNIQPCITFMDFDRSLKVRAFWKAKQNVFRSH